MRLVPREKPLLQKTEEEVFFRLVKAAFGQRRKMALGLIAKAFSLPRLEIERRFADLKLDFKSRAEDISPQDYLKLSRALSAG